ncbi:unnamed protein product [Pocillopora meandrina]|uniref:Uncharacterized protein n=1 Tax=Pocillopora meandrina TaxID=46732 RepID=A0AAU9XQT8_9CNID|nr:unnamed protein product [Pocillopora meandrina]
MAIKKTLCFTLVVLALTCPDEISGDNFTKANGPPVCFGARDTQVEKFVVPVDGKMGGVRLVHLYGYVSCHTPGHPVVVVMKRTRR